METYLPMNHSRFKAARMVSTLVQTLFQSVLIVYLVLALVTALFSGFYSFLPPEILLIAVLILAGATVIFREVMPHAEVEGVVSGSSRAERIIIPLLITILVFAGLQFWDATGIVLAIIAGGISALLYTRRVS